MNNVRTITIIYISFLTLFLVTTFVFSSGRKTFYSAGENQDTVSSLGSSPLLNFLKWDSLWYLKIAQQGYFSPESHAFAAPLFPLLIRSVHFITHQWVFSALIINIILLPLTLHAFIRLLRLDYPDSFSYSVVLVFLSFPFSFFLFLPFTETLFLLLTFSAFYFARKSSWFCALVLAFLAALARQFGVIVLLAILVELIGPRGYKYAFKRKTILVGFLVVIATLFVIWRQLGFFDKSNFTAAINHWQVTFIPFPISIFYSVIALIHFPFSYFSYLFLYGSLFLIIFLISFKRIRPSYYFFLIATLAAILSKQDFGSVLTYSLGRYLLTLFPAFIVLTGILVRRKVLISYLIFSLTLLVFNFLLFLSSNFVG